MMRLVAQREQFAYRLAAPTRMYRGLNLDTTAPGMEKIHSILSGGDWDHPELGGHILDWLKSGPRQGLGTHWTADPIQAERFARWPNEETGRGGNLQAVIEGDWHGDNEDTGRTNTHEFDESGNRIRAFPDEQETTLHPGAQMNVTGLKIRPYDDEYWNGPNDYQEDPDSEHDGPWHEVFKGSRPHMAGLTPDDMDNLSWDWAKGKWVPKRDPEAPLIPERQERAFDYDRHWPGWENNEWERGKRSFVAMAEYDEYAGHHQSPGPGTGFPIHDMSGNEDLGGVPDDWYTHPQYYAHPSEAPGARGMKQTQQMYNRIRGNPEAPVDIYRALPHGNTQFNTGDWVTPSLEYARGHAASEQGPDQDWPVIKSTVPAKHLWQNGDSYYEMGYHGPSHEGQVI